MSDVRVRVVVYEDGNEVGDLERDLSPGQQYAVRINPVDGGSVATFLIASSRFPPDSTSAGIET